MRKILFRGKSVRTGEWVYGSLIKLGKYDSSDNDQYGITDKAIPVGFSGVVYNMEINEVIPETVGGFSGKRDIKGTEVYESNIIEWESEPITKTKRHGIVRIRDCMYVVENQGFAVSLIAVLSWGGVVIGNEFDNPELVEKQPCS
ncbi:YopX family protein [Desulfosporosinus sp. PR]|uniref:YopX family protein n=1 Tax=Candidatus Desulfosporosinus nitrosoreducens TaxID=3401928 RepID=UPI0027FAD2E4|nr:YopX family protein [Desulfosporosinus sp. PR]MDQ7094191.1 YopX family protein [Desulfosporosinus sp. PR]